MEKITIYTSETCPYCKKVKEVLTENNIEFNNLLTKDNEDMWQQIVDLVGMGQLPTVLFNGEYLMPGRDFGNEDNLIKLIQNQKPSKFTKEERLLEKIKTLNFNISNAFNRTNQILTKIEEKLK